MSVSSKTAPIYITSGEPAGIGPDICLALADYVSVRPLVVLADIQLLNERAQQLGQNIKFIPFANQTIPADIDTLYVHHMPLQVPVIAGQLDARNAQYVLAQLSYAGAAAMSGECVAIVTAPVQKSVINEAGITFSGHTEFFQELAGVSRVVMMLATQDLRVALVTTHLPLRAVPDAITPNVLRETIMILVQDLQRYFGVSQPKIAVCGLNPHAGERGYLGREEMDIIIPVLDELRSAGVQVSAPLPADTLFTREHVQQFDAVLAMYHDQGLPVLKAQGFGEAVNITLGLPFIRTSVDHGTALGLAGTGQAQSSSLLAAVAMAHIMIDASVVRAAS